VTIEDPIEVLFRDETASINQREVGDDTESFLSALRAALRQDPDVVLIGEMRDTETVRAALQAAETGHLVLSTLHTVNATETVNRVVDFFPRTNRGRSASRWPARSKASCASGWCLRKRAGSCRATRSS
jgi:twitching motility protein PilT